MTLASLSSCFTPVIPARHSTQRPFSRAIREKDKTAAPRSRDLSLALVKLGLIWRANEVPIEEALRHRPNGHGFECPAGSQDGRHEAEDEKFPLSMDILC